MIDSYKLLAKTPHNPNNALAADDPILQEFLVFDDRESYLAWRAEWKQQYAELSQSIRGLRKEWRAEGSNHNFQLHNNLLRSRALARSMLALRHASKARAEQLYQESKTIAEVA
jgi:hypothetical protein